MVDINCDIIINIEKARNGFLPESSFLRVQKCQNTVIQMVSNFYEEVTKVWDLLHKISFRVKRPSWFFVPVANQKSISVKLVNTTEIIENIRDCHFQYKNPNSVQQAPTVSSIETRIEVSARLGSDCYIVVERLTYSCLWVVGSTPTEVAG